MTITTSLLFNFSNPQFDIYALTPDEAEGSEQEKFIQLRLAVYSRRWPIYRTKSLFFPKILPRLRFRMQKFKERPPSGWTDRRCTPNASMHLFYMIIVIQQPSPRSQPNALARRTSDGNSIAATVIPKRRSASSFRAVMPDCGSPSTPTTPQPSVWPIAGSDYSDSNPPLASITGSVVSVALTVNGLANPLALLPWIVTSSQYSSTIDGPSSTTG
ncbi:hypothetical protein CA13_22440 [Planctomycetes bacterium CA13]|uniref:Uncharacterized protein n=1 Tax=Novipirellula herctigrandis TaxID=2527986 RepID=A0A5C5Z089_9BACT|nr:hypothetical protein CA13_22440 [Planctomycetes bacterium CA13]